MTKISDQSTLFNNKSGDTLTPPNIIKQELVTYSCVNGMIKKTTLTRSFQSKEQIDSYHSEFFQLKAES